MGINYQFQKRPHLKLMAKNRTRCCCCCRGLRRPPPQRPIGGFFLITLQFYIDSFISKLFFSSPHRPLRVFLFYHPLNLFFSSSLSSLLAFLLFYILSFYIFFLQCLTVLLVRQHQSQHHRHEFSLHSFRSD